MSGNEATKKSPRCSAVFGGSVRWGIGLLLWLAPFILVRPVFAQFPTVTTGAKSGQATGNEAPTTMFPHPPDGKYWLSGQMNFIYQSNPSFYAKYSGDHSFRSHYNEADGRVLTIYTGLRFTRSQEVLLDFEEAGGLGLSSALGIAGFPNLDAVRDGTLSQAPYLARIMYHRVFSLSHDQTETSRGPLSTFSELPSRRLEIRTGKFGMTDFFDANSVGSDSHLQFLNWTIDQNGAYDFSADARGYTWGVLVEYQSPAWGARFAEALMPGPKNGGPLVWNLRQANTSDFEFELHRGLLQKRNGVIRLLSYINDANMGIYRYANNEYLEGKVQVPDISNHPLWVTTKYGFGINIEQSLAAEITLYGRFGWNNGKTESWSFTEVDQTFSGGVGLLGHLWKRNNDRAGLAFATNGVSGDHAKYLSYGGLGFVLGDGGVQYGRENLIESYYTAHLWKGLSVGPDVQYVVNPGYNEVRGPIVVPSIRLHIEM